MILHTKNQGSKGLWFQTRRFFHVAPYISLCKTIDPQGRAIFGPRSIRTNLVEVYKVMLNQSSRPCGFREEDFFMLLPI